MICQVLNFQYIFILLFIQIVLNNRCRGLVHGTSATEWLYHNIVFSYWSIKFVICTSLVMAVNIVDENGVASKRQFVVKGIKPNTAALSKQYGFPREGIFYASDLSRAFATYLPKIYYSNGVSIIITTELYYYFCNVQCVRDCVSQLCCNLLYIHTILL